MFILRSDSIAQENNETYTLELVHKTGTSTPTGDGVFFRNRVKVTIIDNDGKDLSQLYFLLNMMYSSLLNVPTFFRYPNYVHGG